MTLLHPSTTTADAAVAVSKHAATPPADSTQAPTSAKSRLRGRWPLAAFVAAPAIFAFPQVGGQWFDKTVTDGGPLAVYAKIQDSGTATHISMALAFIGAIALALFASGFVRFVASRTPAGSGTASLVRLGFGAAVGIAFAVASLKAVFRGGLPDHMDHEMYTKEGMGAIQVFVDQLQYTSLWPLTLAMAAVAVLAFRYRVLPRWYGGFSALLAVAAAGMVFALGLPYFIGLVGPVWLVASGIVVLRHRNREVGVAV